MEEGEDAQNPQRWLAHNVVDRHRLYDTRSAWHIDRGVVCLQKEDAKVEFVDDGNEAVSRRLHQEADSKGVYLGTVGAA
jgi:hypothetical protein